MIIIIVYTIISFLLDALTSNLINTTLNNPSIFNTIYSVICLVIIYNYFDNDNKYLKVLLILGILFDIVYTGTILLNIIIFLVIYIIIRIINDYITNNKSLLAIAIYHIMSYLILDIVHYDNFTSKLLMILPRSIIMTIIYTSLSYVIFKKIYFKKYSKKIK